MKKQLGSRLFILALLLLGTQTAFAVTVTLGNPLLFSDGAKPTTGAFLTAVAANPAPFNSIIGSDATGPNFIASWIFSYAAQANVTGGSLTLGIYDHDSAAAGNQVASFTLNGTIDLTSAINTKFESHGGANKEYDIYTLTLPSSTFAALATGTATFALSLQGHGLGVLGETDHNGAGLGFSTLSVTTQPVPEPTEALLMLATLPLLVRQLRKKGIKV